MMYYMVIEQKIIKILTHCMMYKMNPYLKKNVGIHIRKELKV